MSFSTARGRIEDKKTHERMYMSDEAGMHMLRMYVRNAACEGFQRRGAYQHNALSFP